MNYFDCNAQIGRYGVKHPEAFTTADELLKEMEYSGISEALVVHAMAKEYHPAVGNEMLLDEIEGKPLHPCWTVMPHHTGEIPKPDDLLVSMKQKGVKALRAYPVMHQFRLSDWCAGELLDMVEANGIPLLLDSDQTSYEDVAGILRDHPKLNLALMRVYYRANRYLYPLFEKYENLCIEAATYQVNYGIEEVCKRFGVKRLLFGTGLPVTEVGPSIAQIAYAEISDEEKQMIASGNLRRMLAWGDAR